MPPKRTASTLIEAPNRKRRAVIPTTATSSSTTIRSIKAEPLVPPPQDYHHHHPQHANDDYDGVSHRPATQQILKQEFMDLFQDLQYQTNGVSNSQLKNIFKEQYSQLPAIINELIQESRLSMSKVGNELLYNLISEEVASKFAGLDVAARMVYQIIEKADNKGIWTKDIRMQSNIQQQALNKIFKKLEDRRLIKPIKAVTAKAKKLYMIYDLQPAKEITGGPWYTELEFDHEFVSELRTFVMMCVRKLNGGKGVSLKEIANKMKEANVSRVELNLTEVQQLVQTLAFDYMIEHNGTNLNGEALFVAARRCSSCCEFKWWEVLDDDFHFRDVRFEDGVVLSKHEPHYHTAS
jgi:DNA-directed RNA polymerase III subunit RPC6